MLTKYKILNGVTFEYTVSTSNDQIFFSLLGLQEVYEYEQSILVKDGESNGSGHNHNKSMTTTIFLSLFTVYYQNSEFC